MPPIDAEPAIQGYPGLIQGAKTIGDIPEESPSQVGDDGENREIEWDVDEDFVDGTY